jgi:hypothetical protein
VQGQHGGGHRRAVYRLGGPGEGGLVEAQADYSRGDGGRDPRSA